ncbi:hypothetical protein AB6856_11655 [Rahnella inusitata]
MKKTGEIVASVTLDTTELDVQLSEMVDLLKPTIERLPHHLVSPLLSKLITLVNNIVVCDSSTAAGTGFNIIHSVRLGAEYERLTAAIRAGEFNLESF